MAKLYGWFELTMYIYIYSPSQSSLVLATKGEPQFSLIHNLKLIMIVVLVVV